MPCFFRTWRQESFDPLAVYRRLCPDGPGFLESAGRAPKTGRYSLIPLRKRESYRLDHRGLACLENDREVFLPGDPLAALGNILDGCRVRGPCPSPFPGGFFGYLGYDLARWIEDLPQSARRDREVPALWLDWIDVTLTYDHLAQKAVLATLDQTVDLDCLEAKVRGLGDGEPSIGPSSGSGTMTVPVMDRETFLRRVERAQSYIAAGDIYQANISVRFDAQWAGDPASLYLSLRRINPSPFAGLIRVPGVEIISSSPERLVSLRGGLAETRPIAGTCPRGSRGEEEEQFGRELLGHPKERAEHIMLLDLERNDLGKVCRTGSVAVDELMVLEHYSHVTHIVSNVRGDLRNGLGPFDLIRATFPGGTITGVPKKRCMEIIDELEPVGRGTYTGSAGYISVTGEMDLNILIRSFQLCGGSLSYQVGAGIVADSSPEREWEECLAKGRALEQALREES